MTTQINGPVQGNNALFVIRYKLRQHAIRVAYPQLDGFILFNGRHFTFNPQRWSKYEIDLHVFTSIKNSDFHIVCNETSSQPGLIDNDTALSILNALFYSKPIIFTKQPYFGITVDHFTKEIILAQMPKIRVLDLAAFTSDEMSNLPSTLPKQVAYGLNDNEKVLIRSRIKEHFRDLLQPTRKFKVYRAPRARSKPRVPVS